MASRKRPSVKRYHDRVAARYDDSYDDAFWQWHDALTWDYIRPHIPRDMSAKVVDLGCGTGKWGAKFAKSGYHVTFVDISAKMVDRARQKVGDGTRDDQVAFVQADLVDLSALDDGAFTLATAMGEPVGCSSNPLASLREIRRVLVDDGILIATFDNKLGAIDYYLQSSDPRQLADFLRHGKTHWLTRNVSEQFELHTHTPADVTKLIEAAGFTMLDMVGKTVLPMRHHRHLLAESDDRRWWAKLEKSLCRDLAAIGRAPHIQIACRATPRAR